MEEATKGKSTVLFSSIANGVGVDRERERERANDDNVLRGSRGNCSRDR